MILSKVRKYCCKWNCKIVLPTVLHADVDWNVHNKFYLNVNGDLGIVDKKELNQNSIANRVGVTPRFESKWFSFLFLFRTWITANKHRLVLDCTGALLDQVLRYQTLYLIILERLIFT
jgi:hypothetical protein